MGWLCSFDLGWCSAFVLRWCVYPARCSCGGSAAGALLGWLCRFDLGWCSAFVLRWCVYPAWCCCGGFAAGARLGWLCLALFLRRCGLGTASDGLALPMRLRRPFILRRRACPTARCCGAGCPGYGSRRTGVSCWRDGLGPVSFTDVPCPVTGPRVGLFLNCMFALRYALWLNTLAACRAALTPPSSRRGRRRREMRRLSRANNAA